MNAGPAPTGGPRTILYLAWAPFFSGAERALLLTLQHLDPDRYRPHVIVGTNGEMLQQLRAAGLSSEHRPLKPLSRSGLLPWARSFVAVLATARRVRPALIHANDVPSFQPGGHVARLMGIPAITHVRFPDSEEGFRWFLRPGFARAIFVSDGLRQDSMAIAGSIFANKADVLHDGVRIPPALEEGARREVRAELGFSAETPVVAITGQISDVKGIWEFIEAARILVARGAAATFAVLGDDLKGHGATRRAMEERVAELGLAPHFRFLGFRSDAPRLIPAFDIVAVPSHIEPLGNATLEAMAAGVQVVGSRVGGIPEMVVDGETGRLVPPRAPEALAAAIEALLAAPDLRRAYGLAARARAESHFNLPVHARRLQQTYDTLLGHQP